MIDEAVGFLRENVLSMGYLNQVYGLCELIIKEDKTIPSFYEGKGEALNINEIDLFNGWGYFRKREQVRIDKADNQMTSCDKYYNIRYPMLFVGCVKKSKLVCDNAYAADILAQTTIASLTDTKGLGNIIGALSATSEVLGYTTDTSDILLLEYRNPSIKEMNFKYAYFSIDFDIHIIAKSDCLNVSCYGDTLVGTRVLPTSCNGHIIMKKESFQQCTITSGAIDGNNKTFIWNHAPSQVFWQGQKLTLNAIKNGYTLTGLTTVLTEAPRVNNSVEGFGNF